jgi:peroxiredoxin Q/BCP
MEKLRLFFYRILMAFVGLFWKVWKEGFLMGTELKVDEKAPEFALLDQDNKKVALKDFKGQWVVLYFYPKDMTPGCTIEAIDFTKFAKHFETLGAVIFGVSPDSVESHCQFIKKDKLSIRLLSDPDHAMCEEYGVWQLKKNYGKEYYGIVRTTVLINPEGKIAKLWSPVKVDGHAEEVLNSLESLKKE